MHEQLTASIPEDLLAKKENGCWLWWGPCSPEGAPLISVDVTGKKRRLTRVMWEHKTGKALTEDQRIYIKCKQENCVNPDHLGVETYHQMMCRKKAERRARGGVERTAPLCDDPAAIRRVINHFQPRKYYK